MGTSTITQLTGLAPMDCSCNKCVQMCKTATCIGTPTEMAMIANAGFEDKIMITYLAAPVVKLTLGVDVVKVVAPKFDETKGRCVFLNDKDKCDLHDLGLKPLEGKLANCKINKVEHNKMQPIEVILHLWQEFKNYL